MTGKALLDFLCGTTGQEGMLEKNSGDTSYRAFLLICLNLILKDISNRQTDWHWRFLEKTGTFNTVGSQFAYPYTGVGGIATDIDTNKVLNVYDKTNDFTYKYIPYEVFKKVVADETNNTGSSRFYSTFASKLLLWPVPSGIVASFIDYVRVITSAVDSATEIDIPDKYSLVIVDGVMSLAYKYDPELGNWMAQKQIYDAGVNNMISDNRVSLGNDNESKSHRINNDIESPDSLLFPLA